MKKKFITNLAFLLLLNILIKPIYAFGIDVGVQNAVGAANYGSYFILLSFSLIFQIVLDLGIENYNRREIARDPDLLGEYFSNILPLKLMLGIIYFIICGSIGLLLGWVRQDFGLMVLLLVNQFLASFILYFRSNLGGLHMFRLDSIISVLDRFFVILICGFFLINPVTRRQFRVEWLVYSQTAAYLIVAIISFLIVFFRTRKIHIKFDTAYYLSFLRRSFPYALLILLMAVYLRSDSVLLGILRFDGRALAGIYAQSFRIVEILSNYGYLFTLILLPMFSRMLKHGESVEQLVQLSVKLLFVPAVIITAGFLAFRSEIISLLYVEHTVVSWKVFGILIFGFLGMCTTYIFGTLLTAHGRLFQLNIMAFFAVILSFTLNIMLISRFGVFGAAISHVATQLFTSIVQIILCVRIFHFRFNFTLVCRLVIFTGIAFVAAFLLKMTDLNWITSFFLFLCFTFLLSFITRLLNFKSIMSFLSAE